MYTQTEVCNMALGMIGEIHTIDDMNENTVIANACRRYFKICIDNCNGIYNWAFTRRDEVLTEEHLLSDVVALPYRNAYTIPEDVFKILRLSSVNESSEAETLGSRFTIRFNLRNYDNRKILVTDAEAPLAIQYQCNITDLQSCDPLFIEALTYLLAHKLCSCLIRDASAVSLGKYMYDMFKISISKAAAIDAQQGARGVSEMAYSGFIRARR